MRAIETTGVLDKSGFLKLDKRFKTTKPQKVKVIILYGDDNNEDETEWLNMLSANPAFDFLKDKEEDIYTLTDGKSLAK